MKLDQLINGMENYKAKGDMDIEITGVESNSKKIEPGMLFVAIRGFDFDGHDYVNEAIEKGAVAVVLDMNADFKKIKLTSKVTVIITENSRIALARIACNFYGNPSKKFKLIGITGTKGKTTTTYMVKSILEKAGHKVGLIGTIANYAGDKCLSMSTRTTPESLELQRLFAEMVKEKVDYVVMEVSSQSLKLHRVEGCHFDYAIFTNLYKDHISSKEHPDIEDYFESKMQLFKMVKQGFTNNDDFKTPKLIKGVPTCSFKTYSIDNVSDFVAKDITITNVSVDFKVKLDNRNERIKVNIPGRFSVYNALAAIAVTSTIGVKTDDIKEGLAEVIVPGRNELVPNKEELPIMIDYAHNPESLTNILQAAKSYTKGRVIAVFGCGGDRDSEKRPIMGEIAGRIADYTIITSDNPRTEKPETIVAQIEEGIKKTKGKYEVVVNRKKKKKKAIKMMNKRDLVILAGKGHEVYQEINGEKFDFDERVIVREIVNELASDKKEG